MGIGERLSSSVNVVIKSSIGPSSTIWRWLRSPNVAVLGDSLFIYDTTMCLWKQLIYYTFRIGVFSSSPESNLVRQNWKGQFFRNKKITDVSVISWKDDREPVVAFKKGPNLYLRNPIRISNTVDMACTYRHYKFNWSHSGTWTSPKWFIEFQRRSTSGNYLTKDLEL